MRRALVPLVLLAAMAAAGCGDAGDRETAPPAVPTAPTAAAIPPPVRPQASESGDPVARLTRPARMHSRPGGRVVTRLATRTQWGLPRYLPVVRRRGAWLGVIATERPNGRLGWIRATDTSAAVTRVRIVVDLSARRLQVTRDGRTLLAMDVGVGAPGTPTPTGRFAVTDGLRAARGSPYGCCILALSGHQPSVPQDWPGGDRLAVHGTSDPASIGGAKSLGCLRAHDRDLRRLLRVAQLGAVVDIRA